MEDMDKFCYVYSSSLETRVQIKIGTLEGKRQKPEYDKLLSDPLLKFSGLYQDGFADLMVVCQVFADGRPLALPVCTSYKAFTTRWNWNEWVTLPVMFSDLPRNAQLTFTVYDTLGPSKIQPVGGSTISLFGKRGVFRQGMLDLRVWPNREADGNYPSATPGKARDHGKEQMQRLAKLTKKHRNGHMTKVDWLDRLTFREIEMINEQEKRNSDYMYLMVEFPSVELDSIPMSVVFFEQDGDEVYQFRAHGDLVRVPDHEILQENLVESKHHKLARSLRSGVSDKDAKPNASMRDVLNTIVAYPPTKQLTTEEQDLVWKFRFYLSNQKKALTKFLKCVNWRLNGEVRQALDMLQQWTPMDVEDALELLSSNFTHPAVRRYAVTRLKQAPDEDLLLYLLQLVQALKYENFTEIKESYNTLFPGRDTSQPTQEDPTAKDDGEDVNSTVIKMAEDRNNCADHGVYEGKQVRSNSLLETVVPAEQTDSVHWETDSNQDLATFLIQRACHNSTTNCYSLLYLLIECEDQEPAVKQDSKVRDMYLTVMKTFSQGLKRRVA
ncbi:hypothetical protein L9F63_005725, partial [Diploptera punctata]